MNGIGGGYQGEEPRPFFEEAFAKLTFDSFHSTSEEILRLAEGSFAGLGARKECGSRFFSDIAANRTTWTIKLALRKSGLPRLERVLAGSSPP